MTNNITVAPTVDDHRSTRPANTGEPAPRLRQLEPDVLRDVHKGIRAALFAVTNEAGCLDPSDDLSVAALESEIRGVARLLADHARHEDEHVDLTLLPAELAGAVERDHAGFDARMRWIVELAATTRRVPTGARRWAIHELYLELASFTGAYLCHQDDEERLLVPTLIDRLGTAGVAAIHDRIIEDMQPDEFTRGLVTMLPAINVDDRCDMLAAMRVGMPPEAFAHVWSLATSILSEDDADALAARLGL